MEKRNGGIVSVRWRSKEYKRGEEKNVWRRRNEESRINVRRKKNKR
jgi:hypothetical protein